MERRQDAPSWRGSLGLTIALIAAVLLGIVLWRAVWLNDRAGGDVATLARERVAIDFERLGYPLLVDMTNYRSAMMVANNPPSSAGLRARIDAQLNKATAFISKHQSALPLKDESGKDEWSKVVNQWADVETLPRVYTGRKMDAMLDTLDDVVDRVQDVTGVQYDLTKYGQDLSDALFNRIPLEQDVVNRADYLGENAQSSRLLSIPDRMHMARYAGEMRSDLGGYLDFSSDDYSYILGHIEALGMGTKAEAARYAIDYTRASDLATSFARSLSANIVLSDLPAGDPRATRARTTQISQAISIVNNDVTAMADRMLTTRIGFAAARNRYFYIAALLAAVLLVGIMLLVAEVTAWRDRNLLEQARRESERLAAELARQNAERALRLSEAQFRAVFDGAALGIAVLDKTGSILDANSVFRTVYGDNGIGVLEGHEAEFAELMRGERDLFEFEQHVMTPAGQEAWTDSTISLVNDETGKPSFAICMFRDLTELKRNERRIMHDMTHDSLTGLPNRSLFEQQAREQFAEMKAKPQSPFAVLFVDIDRFKDINESLGHDAGDFVISQVGHRIRAAIEAADVVARLGSDEFAVLVRSLPDVLHVEVIARRVLSALARPVALGSRSIFVSGSVGIALASTNYQRGEDVMRDADIAMRYAKSGGGSRFAIFDSKMHARAEKRLQLTTDLRLALEHGEFDLLFQPIVSIGDDELAGCEALLRWNHPVEGVMLPADFMPLAEQTGLAVPIGRFVLRTACQQLARWKRALGPDALFPINVNVSATELLHPEFESTVMAATREFGVSPSELCLEITESVVLDAGTRPNALVEHLRELGFQICIDDFGTGYSSLRYLQQFKVDAIKIDRSFVSGSDGDVASEPIVRTLMTLAEAFDVRVVAEGIETARQREVLRSAGCRYGQGFYYARALSVEQFAATYPAVFSTPRPATA